MSRREKWGSGLMFLFCKQGAEKQVPATVGSGRAGDTPVCAEATAVGEDTWKLMGCGVWPCQERQATHRDAFLG